jgi:hypothetical protein
MKITKSLTTVFLFLPFYFLLFTFSGCYTPSHEKEIWDIDTLHKAVERSLDKLALVDTSQIKEMFEIYTHNKNRARQINNNNLTSYDKDIIQQYEGLNDIFFLKYKSQLREYYKGLNNSLKQLDSLKNDVTRGLIPKSTFDRRFRYAKRTAVTLNEEVFIFSKYINNYKNLYNRLDPKIMKLCSGNKK